MFNRMLSSVLMTLATSVLLFSKHAYAVTNNCEWSAAGGGPAQLAIDVGSLYVPRDAKIGDAIGPADKLYFSTQSPYHVYCSATSTQLFLNVAAMSPQVSVPGFKGTVLETDIPGVGVQLDFRSIYMNFVSPTDYIVPYNSTVSNTGHQIEYNQIVAVVRLVKTAAIAPGKQILGRDLAKVSFTSIPDAFTLRVTGDVTQAECSLTSNPVNPAPVDLGEWQASDFTGEGHSTASKPFNITLNSCVADPSGALQTNAYIRLDPASGSTTVDKSNGIFTSSLKGIGIQVLAADGTTPVPLEEEVLQGAITPGDMSLDFQARFYQTEATVEGGQASGALSFTITYK